MDRKVFKYSSFGKNGTTNLPCPTCKKGDLVLDNNSLTTNTPKYIQGLMSTNEFDITDYWASYICVLKCNKCGESISNTGEVRYIESYFRSDADSYEIDYDETYMPRYFIPNLTIFSIPEKTPDDIVRELIKSFSLFFSDPSSSANHARIAVENLLNHYKVPRFSLTKKKKRQRNTLHDRINKLDNKYEHIKDELRAIKWIGNAGSHSSIGENSLTGDDVLDAYEILESVLDDLFSTKKKQIKGIAKSINKKKGPRNKTKKKR